LQQSVTQEPSYILHSWPFGENGLLLDVLSYRFGKLRLVAKGVKRKGNAQGALLRPLQPLLLGWQGKGSLQSLISTDIQTQLPALSGDYLFSAFYLNELLQTLLSYQDPVPALFIAYADAIGQMSERVPLEGILRRFEWRLLCELGAAPDLKRGSSGDTLECDRYYAWHPESGFVLQNTAINSRLMFSGQQLRELALLAEHAVSSPETKDPSPFAGEMGILKVAKSLFRQIINHQLQGRPLKSRELMLRYRALDGRASEGNGANKAGVADDGQ